MNKSQENASSPAVARLSLLPDEQKNTPAIGLVVPFDFRLDDECWRWLPKDTSLYITRTPRLKNETITINLAKALTEGPELADAVHTLTANEPQAIAYGCSAASFIDGLQGEKHLLGTMLAAGAPAAVTTSGAMSAAMKYLGVKRVAVATPYTESLTKLLGEYLRQDGFEVVSNGYLDKDGGIYNIGYEAVRRLAEMVDRPEAKAIFFSCTNLRTFDVLEELELLLGKPVLSANQVTMWAALRAAGLPTPNLNQRLFKPTVGRVADLLVATPALVS